jgi:hypothetical protein
MGGFNTEHRNQKDKFRALLLSISVLFTGGIPAQVIYSFLPVNGKYENEMSFRASNQLYWQEGRGRLAPSPVDGA